MRRWTAFGVFSCGVLGLAGGALAFAAGGRNDPSLSHHASVPAIVREGPPPTPTPAPTPVPVRSSAPVVALHVPSAGIDGSFAIEERDTKFEGSREVLQDPSSPGLIAWYPRFGHPSQPAQDALFAAHINYIGYGNGPFADLVDAQVGGTLELILADGTDYLYTIESVQLIPLAVLDNGGMQDVVYPPLDSYHTRVTLLSCGGDFVPYNDGSGAGEYTSRVVVTARALCRLTGLNRRAAAGLGGGGWCGDVGAEAGDENDAAEQEQSRDDQRDRSEGRVIDVPQDGGDHGDEDGGDAEAHVHQRPAPEAQRDERAAAGERQELEHGIVGREPKERSSADHEQGGEDPSARAGAQQAALGEKDAGGAEAGSDQAEGGLRGVVVEPGGDAGGEKQHAGRERDELGVPLRNGGEDRAQGEQGDCGGERDVFVPDSRLVRGDGDGCGAKRGAGEPRDGRSATHARFVQGPHDGPGEEDSEGADRGDRDSHGGAEVGPADRGEHEDADEHDGGGEVHHRLCDAGAVPGQLAVLTGILVVGDTRRGRLVEKAGVAPALKMFGGRAHLRLSERYA